MSGEGCVIRTMVNYWIHFYFFFRLYIWACLVFPMLFYIPKWFELNSELGLKPACARLKKSAECLIAMTNKNDSITIQGINQILTANCWRNSTTPVYEVCSLTENAFSCQPYDILAAWAKLGTSILDFLELLGGEEKLPFFGIGSVFYTCDH